MEDEKIQQALYIKDLIIQRDRLIYTYSNDNIDSLWTECATNLPDTIEGDYEPTYLHLLVGLDSLLEDVDSPEDEILKVRDYISSLVDIRLGETVEIFRKRVIVMNKNIEYLKKKFKKDWSSSYEDVISEGQKLKEEPVVNLNIDEILDKINSKGMSSLTKDEKNFLRSNSKNDGDDKKDDKK